MRRTLIFLGMVTITALLLAGVAQATVFGYTSNPTGNSIDWTNAIAGLGGTINNTVNFDTHPTGVLQSNFYAGVGVTLTANGANGEVNSITYGAGPGQPNAVNGPFSTGEGLHPQSNYLNDGTQPSTLIISFASPVLGAELFVIDYFNPFGDNPLTVAAYTGQGGTGTLLGTFSSVAYNFESNYMYFMGIVSSNGDIGSLVFTDVQNIRWDEKGIDNIVFATSSAVPLPSTLLLLGSGLLGLAGWRRFRKG